MSASQIKRFLFAGIATTALFASATEWENIDSEHYLGGRKASAGYLQGKVVMIFSWPANDEQPAKELLSALEDVWTNFKTKQFVLIGAPVGKSEANESLQRLIKKHGVSYPVYRNASFGGKTVSLPSICILDETGKIVYAGYKIPNATQALVTALTDIESPRTLEQWQRFLDYELAHAPCHAYLRLKAFREKFPKEALKYANGARALATIPNLKETVNFIAFSKKAKDPPVFGPGEEKKKQKYQELVMGVISKGEELKACSDPRVVQEVKNALADLKWTQAKF